MQVDKRTYSPVRAEDSENDVNEDNGLSETLVSLLKNSIGNPMDDGEGIIPTVHGPILSLFAGTAGAEKSLLQMVQDPEEKRILAIDYNDRLMSKTPELTYLHGDVFERLEEIPDRSYGALTIFAADGSIRRDQWPMLWTHIDRVLKDEGYVLIFPEFNMNNMPAHFRRAIDVRAMLIAVKTKPE